MRWRRHFPTRSPALRAGTVAFTLIEIMIAITIFGLVMTGIFASWSAILRGSRVGMVAAAEVQRTRVAMRAVEESLASAILYPDNPKYYSFYGNNEGQFGFLSFVARLPASFPGSGAFGDQPIRRVIFEVVNGVFVLRQRPLLEATDLVSRDPYTITLSPQTRLFALEFLDPQKGEWISDWPIKSTNKLPRLIRVAMGFGPKQPGKAEFNTVRTIYLSPSGPARNATSRIGPTPSNDPVQNNRFQ